MAVMFVKLKLSPVAILYITPPHWPEVTLINVKLLKRTFFNLELVSLSANVNAPPLVPAEQLVNLLSRSVMLVIERPIKMAPPLAVLAEVFRKVRLYKFKFVAEVPIKIAPPEVPALLLINSNHLMLTY